MFRFQMHTVVREKFQTIIRPRIPADEERGNNRPNLSVTFKNTPTAPDSYEIGSEQVQMLRNDKHNASGMDNEGFSQTPKIYPILSRGDNEILPAINVVEQSNSEITAM